MGSMRSMIRPLVLAAFALGVTAGGAFAHDVRAGRPAHAAITARSTTHVRASSRPHRRAAHGAHHAAVRHATQPARTGAGGPLRHLPHRPRTRAARASHAPHRDGPRSAVLGVFRVPLDPPLVGALAWEAGNGFASVISLREAGRGPPRASPDAKSTPSLFARLRPTSARPPHLPIPQTLAIERPATAQGRRLRARRRRRHRGRFPFPGVRPHTSTPRPGGAQEPSVSPPSGGFTMLRRSWSVASALGALVLIGSFASLASATPASPMPAKATASKVASTSATAARTAPAVAAGEHAKTASATAAKAAPARADRLDINTASKEELEKVPGIGEAIAAKIVAGRPFKAKRELLSRGLVNRGEYAKLAPHVIAKQAAGEVSKSAPAEGAKQAPAEGSKQAPSQGSKK